MLTNALLINAIVLFVVLESDLGPARKLTRFRLVRPLISAGVVIPMFMQAFATTGTGLVLEIAGGAAGILLGLLAGELMTVRRDATSGRIVTGAGWAYAGLWIAVVAARSLFSIGSEKWFNHAFGTWMINNHVGANAIVDTLIVMALAMTLARTVSISARALRLSGTPRLAPAAA